MQSYYFLDGITKLSKKLKGDERICLTIRPYGFHAGNQIPFTVYTRLLCEELEKQGKKAKFTIYVVLNDWEQIKLGGPDIKAYPFNVYPIGTTLQYTKHTGTKKWNIVDYWGAKIFQEVLTIKDEHPLLKIILVKTSDLKNTSVMKSVLIKTLKSPEIFMDILRKYSTKKLLSYPSDFVIAVCPKCKRTKGKTKLLKRNKVAHFCSECFEIFINDYSSFDYWLYHTHLALPKYKIYDIDLSITGADKIDESDYKVREKLIEAYGMEFKMPVVLYSPLVIDSRGVKMGKSRGNDKYININELRKLVIKSNNTGKIIIE